MQQHLFNTQPLVITQDDVLYEDAWLLALYKQPGWYTTPTLDDVVGNNIRAGLTRFLQARDGDHITLHLAHQLDRDTSGILLCSLNREVNAPLQVAFASGTIEKTYHGVCEGEPLLDRFELITGHGRKLGGWTTYDLEQVGVILPNGKPIRRAHTSFVVERRMGDAAVVRAMLHTGRTHQIRLHLAAVGHPLVGDTRYGTGAIFRGQAVPFHMLHAGFMRLVHPVTKVVLELTAPLPAHMVDVMRSDDDQSHTMVSGD
jgi:23S rRNA pseudouridine1911/1915/1917 synthase